MDFREWYEKKYKDQNGWELIEPTAIGEYPRSSTSARDLRWFQWRLEGSEKSGRPLINIDKNTLNWKYFTTNSRSAPTDQPWIHKPDSNKGDLEVIDNIDLERLGVGEDWNKPNILHGPKVAW